MLEHRGALFALDLINTATQGLAGKETGHVAHQSTGRPEVVKGGQLAHRRQIQFALTVQTIPPALWHGGDGLCGCSQFAVQGVFGAAVDDALGFDALAATQGAGFQQQGAIALLAQAGIEPQAGNATTQNANVGFQRCAHGPR